MIQFTVGGEPFGQERPAVTTIGGHPHLYDRPRSKAYKANIAFMAIASLPDGFEPLKSAIRLQVTMYYPIPKSFSKKRKQEALEGKILPKVKPDLSNVLKGIEDALNGIVYEDDKQITSIGCRKVYSDNPRVEIFIYEEE